MLIEINAYFIPDDYDPEEYQTLGKKIKYQKGKLVINSEHIVAYSPTENGETMIRLSNSEVFQATYKFKAFDELMRRVAFATKMLSTEDN